MPIKIPNDLPARLTLEKEGVMVMTEDSAHRQDIRPLRIGLLNLMPNKIRTETQFARLIGATPLQVELSLIKITKHTSKNTPNDHMIAFYRDWEKVRKEKFDGLIITGAPIELLEFEDVTYWDELQKIYDWTQTHVQSTFNICWGPVQPPSPILRSIRCHEYIHGAHPFVRVPITFDRTRIAQGRGYPIGSIP